MIELQDIEFPEWKLVVKLLVAYAWPLTVILVLLILKKEVFGFLKDRNISYTTKEGELVLSLMKNKESLLKLQRDEIKGLTANEIWALQTFRDSPDKCKFSEMRGASKVMAKVLLEAGMLENKGDHVALAPLGHEVLEAANRII